VPLGGSFTLVNSDGKIVTDEDFRGKWMFIYFGFTHCPDICPTEMHKMHDALANLSPKLSNQIVPIFITIDPARDSCERIEKYLKDEGLNGFVGLTGTADQIKNACKKFRVFYSAPDYSKSPTDYNIDHSIFFYLMNPEGKFVEYFARNQSVQDVTNRLTDVLTNSQLENQLN
jgi:protein SCO1/2